MYILSRSWKSVKWIRKMEVNKGFLSQFKATDSYWIVRQKTKLVSTHILLCHHHFPRWLSGILKCKSEQCPLLFCQVYSFVKETPLFWILSKINRRVIEFQKQRVSLTCLLHSGLGLGPFGFYTHFWLNDFSLIFYLGGCHSIMTTFFFVLDIPSLVK